MFDEKVLQKEMDDYFDSKTKEQILQDLTEADCLHLIEKNEGSPYLEGFEVRTVAKYNPNYGDKKVCECGHSYYRHFDSYEDMDAVGCKYCRCFTFKEAKQKEEEK